MTELVFIRNNRVATTSLQVAEAFNKRHDRVLEAIETKLNSPENSGQLNNMFYLDSYKDNSGKSNKMYVMNRDGWTFIAMGFTGSKADSFKLQYISAFNQMEEQLSLQSLNVPQTYAGALRLAADLEEENQLLEQKVAEYEPRINYLDLILGSTDTVTIGQIAADYGMSAIQMNKLLNELGVQHKIGGQWILYKKHMRQGFVKSHTTEIPKATGGRKTVMNTKWTQKGRLFIYELLKENGTYPLIDLEDIA